ncbi:MAG: hypothetical protein ACO3FI_11480 [Cyclobacteriaceae bacterium]
MRLLKDFVQDGARISVFHWNNKYLIKLEAGPFEQTFKINEFDLESEDQLHVLIDNEFISKCMERFSDMAAQLATARRKSEE